jgi:hypothetical protein
MIKLTKYKVLISVSLALVVGLIFLVSPMQADACDIRNAADSKFIWDRKVAGDGVRLRNAPSINATILELMYMNEGIKLCSELVSPPAGNQWVHVRRNSTGTKGYMDYIYYHHY